MRHTPLVFAFTLPLALLAGCGSTVATPDASADAADASDPGYTPYAPTGARPVSISLGGHQGCALLDDGRAYCWGDNTWGQIGIGATTAPQARPIAVRGIRNVTGVTTGSTFACALSSGAPYCWGSNSWGQLGNGTNRDSITAAAVTGLSSGVRALSAGGALLVADACALLDDGTVRCWGRNANPADPTVPLLGVGATSELVTTPMTVLGLTSVRQVSIGDAHVCALLANQTVMCWGWNNRDQCGRDGVTSVASPSTVADLADAVEVAPGQFHTCARRRDGSVVCWGDDSFGQLGDGTTGARATIAPARGVTGATQVASGDDFSCAIVANGAVLCWGRNLHGQRGRTK